jgi:hypothetical protein
MAAARDFQTTLEWEARASDSIVNASAIFRICKMLILGVACVLAG